MNEHESITDPEHYKGEIECWNVIWQLYGVNGCLSHMMGYNFRAGKKEGGALPDTTNIPPLSKSLPQPLEEHEGSV